MRDLHIARLLAGHALAEERPLGPLLRALPSPRARRAAARAEAGDLADALDVLDLPADLVALATAWPGALRPAQRRLAAIPSTRLLQLPLVETLLYVGGLAGLQWMVFLLVELKIEPTLHEMGVEMGHDLGVGQLMQFGLIPLGVLAAVVLVLLGILVGVPDPARLPGWGAHLRRAREAALAAALAEAGAPLEIRTALAADFRRLRMFDGSAAELDLVATQALSDTSAAHQRLVAAVRVVGFSVLALVAVLITAGIYGAIALLPALP